MRKKFRKTNALEKLWASACNVVCFAVVAIPLGLYMGFDLYWKLSIITLFFLVTIVGMWSSKSLGIGMYVMKTQWAKVYPFRQKLLYAVLYTASVSTLFFWVLFPFDLLIINLLFVQLPTVLLTGTTFHGFMAGRMVTVTESGTK